MTGPGPNPLAGLADEAVVVDAPSTAAPGPPLNTTINPFASGPGPSLK